MTILIETMNSCLSKFRIFRFLKGGVWIKTAKRGWITGKQYDEYINTGFDPIRLKQSGKRNMGTDSKRFKN